MTILVLAGCAVDASPDAHRAGTTAEAVDHIEAPWMAEDLGGVVLGSDPVVIGDAVHKKLFYQGPNAHLWMSTYDGGPWWSAPADLGGVQLTSAPAAAITGPNKVKVWYRGPNGHLWMSTYDGGPWWSAPADLGGVTLDSAPSVVVRGDGKYSVFYRGPNAHLWMSTYDGGPWWSAPADLGGVAMLSGPAAVIPQTEPTHIRVFYKGTDQRLWMSSYDGGPWWSAPADLGGYALAGSGGFGAVSASAHAMDVFYSGLFGQLMHSEWSGGPWWSAPFQDGVAIAGTPSALNAKEVYYRGANGHLFVAHPATAATAPVTTSGLLTSREGHPLLVTQGISGNTLVAGKQMLLRMFVSDPSKVANVTLTVANPDGSQPNDMQVGKGALLVETAAPLGPSVGVIVPGNMVPNAASYSIALSATDASGAEIQRASKGPLVFLPTVDVRFDVVMMRHAGAFEPDGSWNVDIMRSMNRLASMMPVRDGVDTSATASSCSGLRYTIGTACDGWTDGYYSCVYGQTRALDTQLGAKNQIDVTVEYRPGFYAPQYNPPGDPGPGGNSGRPPSPFGDLRRASCVSGNWNGIEMTAACIAQETGHNYGMEAPSSPHYNDPNDPGHSKDPFITDPYAFDFVNKRHYGKAVGDTMNNSGGGSFQGEADVMYNAFDWEFLRQQLMAQKKAGATGTGQCGP